MAEFTVECRRCGRTMQLIGPIEINYLDECSMCDEDRVSLPKRGDRVRVVEALYQPSLVGLQLTLSSDCSTYADFIRFRCEEAGYVGPVKVEILERAGECIGECAHCDEPMVKAEVITDDGAHFCSERCYAEYFPKPVHPEFARGMRRAVKIAEGLGFGAYGNRSLAYVDELKEAVEKELEVVTTPAPPLTVAELDSMSNMRANLWPFGWVNRVIAQARRALTLESELDQLRREKAEREGLERRHTEWVLAAPELGRQVLHYWKSENRHTVQLVYYRDEQHARDGHTEGRPRICSYGHGPTYEAALVAALDKLAPARGVAGDHCEAGNECGRIGCPECQQ